MAWRRRPLRREPDAPYPEDVSTARSLPPVEPVPYPTVLEEYAGKWVAVVEGHVVAAADTSRELVYEIKKRAILGAIVQYVPRASRGVKVGLG